MKKTIYIIVFLFALSAVVKGQAPVTWAAAIPIEFTVEEILRVNVTSGGNIEFIFTNMNQYNNGISNSGFYNTTIQIASSSNWQLNFGADGGFLFGTDDPTNQMLLDNVGYMITTPGAPTNPISSGPPANGTQLMNSADVAPEGLVPFPFILMNPVGTGNPGDVTDNNFTFNWECGTQAGTMNGNSLLKQVLPLKSDRYITTVLLEIIAL